MSHETIPANRRLYLIFQPTGAGKVAIRLSVRPPDIDAAYAALLVRGMIMRGSSVDVDLVSDPKQDPELAGEQGPNGWTPVLQAEADGTRTLVKVADWVRSSGKPAAGYLTAAGVLTSAKADAFNFNASKRVASFSGVSNASGIANISFGTAFTSSAAAPQVVIVGAVPNVPVGGIKAEIVAGSITKTGCQVKVTGAALLSSVVAALAGATANVIAIDA